MKVCQIWYSEISNFDFVKPNWSSNSGHFSQMIWKSTKDIGIGLASSNGRFYIVSQYSPPGNILGHFEENISPSI